MAVNETTSVDVKTLRPFKRFIMTIGLLPTSYLESMTYAELVMWFCNFLQEQVIPTVNNNAEAVIELQNWFNNLDVQDEIDNKLDQMTEDGTLQEIITDYLNSKAIFAFDTVADMKEATNLIDGSYTRTLGYHELNDNGGSLYKVREIKNTDTVDEMLIIALNDENLVAELILNNIMNVEQFGAYGDNEHDDSDYIQKAINNCKNIIFNSNKTYLVNNNIYINNKESLTIKGSNINYTKSGNLFNLYGSCYNIEIYNFNVTGITTGNTLLQSFISNLSDESNSFENINIHNNTLNTLTLGISINADLSGHLRNIIIENNTISDILVRGAGTGYGIHISDGQDEDVYGIIRNNDISSCASHCIYVARGSKYTIENNYIHNNGDAIGDLAPAINLSRSKNITFKNNVIENVNNGGLFFSSELNPSESYSQDSYPCENILIDNNIFKGASNQYIILAGYGEASTAFSKNITITNNKFEQTNALAIYGIENVKIMNNDFDTIANVSPIQIHSGTNETAELYTHNIYIANNNFKIVLNQQRPIKLGNTIISKDAKIVVENNIVNTGKILQTSTNVSNNLISVIHQVFNNDFYFNSTYHFDPVYVNGVNITA